MIISFNIICEVYPKMFFRIYFARIYVSEPPEIFIIGSIYHSTMSVNLLYWDLWKLDFCRVNKNVKLSYILETRSVYNHTLYKFSRTNMKLSVRNPIFRHCPVLQFFDFWKISSCHRSFIILRIQLLTLSNLNPWRKTLTGHTSTLFIVVQVQHS